jgi:hypothetical protein
VARGGAVVDEAAASAWSKWDAVLFGEQQEGGFGATDLLGDVADGPLPGEVLLAQPGGVDVVDAGGGVDAARGRCADPAGTGWPLVAVGQGVGPYDVAQVFGGQAELLGDMGDRGVVEQDAVDRGGVGVVGIDTGPVLDGDPAGGWLPLQGLVGDAGLGQQPGGVLGEGGDQPGG